MAFEDYGEYATDLFTTKAEEVLSQHNKSQPLFLYMAHLAVHSANFYSPLQAPADAIRKFEYIKDPQRRRFAAMLDKLDQSIGRVVQTLHEKEMLQNSIILFTTDNGGMNFLHKKSVAGYSIKHFDNSIDRMFHLFWFGANFSWSASIVRTILRPIN